MSLTIETKYGPVRGLQEGPVRVWRGLPYAQAPVGEGRFRAPQPPQPWTKVREATAFGAVAPQLSVGLESRFNVRPDAAPPPAQSEDCLFLNVWSPTTPGKYPVMVWVHGGSFVTGSGSMPLYDGARFAAQGEVVVVTLNYRLGALGFLHLADIGPAFDNNLGLLDQIAALRWVQQNIAAFGGDPSRVTVFGESAGAMSIAALLGMPAAEGLFQAAILQSGAVRLQQPAQAKLVAQGMLRELGVSDPAALRTLPVEALLQAAQRLLRTFQGGLPFQPVLDVAALPMHPLEALATGARRFLPLLIGTNRDEGNLFVPPDATGQHLERLLTPYMAPEQALAIARQYPASRQGQAELITDTVFWLSSLQLAERQLSHAPVWMYRFDWQVPSGQPIPGAFHALELGFVWNALDMPAAQIFLSNAPAPQSLADAMHRAWLAFAHHHDPNGPGLLPWPRYELPARATLIFATESHVEENPQQARRKLWAGTALG
ncbi:carboxylesterase/lipase family protein [Hymenobacter setariae]|uniref:Carboxylic ester hydrolase n=1 Tax=Hymenobacter setariae TaxID=2594794 RepID=A0A558C1L1_9BACT|nr:carboxylesterase/lipase family protein [Hymenobacter setariae]TVT42675.1 carboxylesterase/lipase family protein [Hymenobacter setariae]